MSEPRSGWHKVLFDYVPLAATIVGTIVVLGGQWQSFDDSRWPAPTCSNHAGLQLVSDRLVTTTASSSLPPDPPYSYDASNTLDGDTRTVWTPKGGRNDRGQSITYHFATPVNLRLVCVVNGYPQDADTYVRNGAVKDVTMTTDSGRASSTMQRLEVDHMTDDQKVRVTTGRTRELTLTIASFYAGTNLSDLKQGWLDTNVSEVELYVR